MIQTPLISERFGSRNIARLLIGVLLFSGLAGFSSSASAGVHGKQYEHGGYRDHGRHVNRHYGRHSRHYGSRHYGRHHYRHGRHHRDGAYLIGGIIVGSLITHALQPRHRDAHVVHERRVIRQAPVNQRSVTRHLYRDRNGNCFERNHTPSGDEVLSELPPSQCAW